MDLFNEKFPDENDRQDIEMIYNNIIQGLIDIDYYKAMDDEKGLGNAKVLMESDLKDWKEKMGYSFDGNKKTTFEDYIAYDFPNHLKEKKKGGRPKKGEEKKKVISKKPNRMSIGDMYDIDYTGLKKNYKEVVKLYKVPYFNIDRPEYKDMRLSVLLSAKKTLLKKLNGSRENTLKKMKKDVDDDLLEEYKFALSIIDKSIAILNDNIKEITDRMGKKDNKETKETKKSTVNLSKEMKDTIKKMDKYISSRKYDNQNLKKRDEEDKYYKELVENAISLNKLKDESDEDLQKKEDEKKREEEDKYYRELLENMMTENKTKKKSTKESKKDYKELSKKFEDKIKEIDEFREKRKEKPKVELPTLPKIKKDNKKLSEKFSELKEKINKFRWGRSTKKEREKELKNFPIYQTVIKGNKYRIGEPLKDQNISRKKLITFLRLNEIGSKKDYLAEKKKLNLPSKGVNPEIDNFLEKDLWGDRGFSLRGWRENSATAKHNLLKKEYDRYYEMREKLLHEIRKRGISKEEKKKKEAIISKLDKMINIINDYFYKKIPKDFELYEFLRKQSAYLSDKMEDLIYDIDEFRAKRKEKPKVELPKLDIKKKSINEFEKVDKKKSIKESKKDNKELSKKFEDKIKEIDEFRAKRKEKPKIELPTLPKIKKESVSNSFKKYEDMRERIYTVMFKILRSPSKRSIQQLNKELNLDKNDFETFKKILSGRKSFDFIPTPLNILKPFLDDYKEGLDIKYFEKETKILEPSCGLGYVIHHILKVNPKAIITAYEINDDFIEMLDVLFPKNAYPNVTIHKKNFLEVDDKNDYELVFCNPPFTDGNDKKFYLDFYFKIGKMLNDNNSGSRENVLYFISPPLYSNMPRDFKQYGKDNTIDPYYIVESDYLSKSKIEDISKEKLTAGEYKTLKKIMNEGEPNFKTDEAEENYYNKNKKILGIFNNFKEYYIPYQIQIINEAKFTIGTNYTAYMTFNVYINQGYKSGGAVPKNKKLYKRIKEAIYSKYPKHSLFRSSMIVKKYKDEGGKYMGDNKKGIKNWFKEKWVSLPDYVKGDIVACGESDLKGLYPLCRPLSIAKKLSVDDIKKMMIEKNKLGKKPLITKKVLGSDKYNIGKIGSNL
jgi:hypothetical protein